jgi:serine protease inhibitor
MAITIRVPWDYPGNNLITWNEVCAWCIEHFGLPGKNFTTHPTEEYMDFVFNDKNNALMFQLYSGGIRKDNPELTVEFVNSMING